MFVPPQGSPGAQCAPLHGVHGGVGFAVNRGVFPQPVGAGFIPPGVFVPPQGSPGAQCAPLHGVHGGVGFAVGRGGFLGPQGRIPYPPAEPCAAAKPPGRSPA